MAGGVRPTGRTLPAFYLGGPTPGPDARQAAGDGTCPCPSACPACPCPPPASRGPWPAPVARLDRQCPAGAWTGGGGVPGPGGGIGAAPGFAAGATFLAAAGGAAGPGRTSTFPIGSEASCGETTFGVP